MGRSLALFATLLFGVVSRCLRGLMGFMAMAMRYEVDCRCAFPVELSMMCVLLPRLESEADLIFVIECWRASP